MARREAEQSERHVQICIQNENISGLSQVLLAEDTKAVVAKLAIDGLINLNMPEGWDALSEILVLREGPTVELAIWRLSELRSGGATRVLGDALRNEQPFIRMAAVRALSSYDTSGTLAFLLRAAHDRDGSIKKLATRAIVRRVESKPALLAELRTQTAEGVLDLLDDRWNMTLLSDSYPESVRLLAAERLGRIGGDEAVCALASVAETAKGKLGDACWTALERCESLPDHVLLPLLANRDPEVRSRAGRVYSRVCGEEAIGLLLGLAGDALPSVRSAALDGLVRILKTESIPNLVAALKDTDEEVQLTAIRHLTSIDDSSPELAEAVETSTGEVRRLALVCLANRGVVSPGLVMPYIEFLLKGSTCTDIGERDYLDGLTAAAKALAHAGAPEALLALTSLARSVIKRIRRMAIESLMLFEPDDRSEALFSLIDTYDQDVLKNVAMGLHEARDNRAPLALVRATYECRGRALAKAKEALYTYPHVDDLGFLVKCLREKWATVRRFGAERLKILRDPVAIPPLLEASRDEDVEVQLAVFEAVGPFAGDHEGVRGRMLEALGYGDISVRQASAEALGEARCKEAVPDLIRCLHNFFLRPRVTEALKRIGDRKGYLAMKKLERREKLFPRKPRVAPGTKKKKKRVADEVG